MLCWGHDAPALPAAPAPARPLRQGAADRRRLGFEPKWDGFRAIAFVDGDDVYIQSRNGRPLTRYFPELKFPAGRYVLDGEIVLFDEQGRQDFDALGQRIHPAESRINMLAEQTPTRFIAFDLLAEDDESLLELPQHERRAAAGEARGRSPSTSRRSPSTPTARRSGCEGAEGVVAKQLDAPYWPGERTGMMKIKRVRTIDAVVHGLAARQGGGHGRLADPRPLRRERRAAHGRPHLRASRPRRSASCRPSSTPYETGERGMGDPSRWASDRELEWVELRPELVVEVTFDHTSNDRIRHGDEDLALARGQAAGRVPDRPVAASKDRGDSPFRRATCRP